MTITEGVTMLQSSAGSHVFLIQADDNVLIDTGNPGEFNAIWAELRSLGVDSIDHILLTHHDVDHIGNAHRLQKQTDARVWASREDIPYIIGEKPRPGIKRIIQGIVRVEPPRMSGSYSHISSFGDIQVIPAPGHTPGHVICLYHHVLFTGDLFAIKHGTLRLFPAYLTWNSQALSQSLALLKTLPFDWVCPAHGQPLQRNDAVERFLRQY